VAEEIVPAAEFLGVLRWGGVAAPGPVGVPAARRAAAHGSYLALVARDLRIANLVATVDTALTGAEVSYAVYKGPAVARHYPRPALRMFGDLDVLISRADLQRADDALRAAGLQGGWIDTPSAYAETMYVLGSSGTLDMHWHVMREAPVRSAFAVDTSAMLSRAVRLPLYEGDAFVLDDYDLLIAVATHACFDGAYRLGWLVDVAQLLRVPGLSMDELRARCAATRTALPVQVVIDRTVRALGVPGVAPPLARGAWRAAMSRLSAARPVERTFRQAGRGGLVFRATRSGSARSAAALVRLGFAEGLVPLARDRGHRWRTRRTERL
jgi:hypothetical protein